MFFGWLRRRAYESVIGGVQDAFTALTPDGDEPPCSVDEFRQRLAAAVSQPRALEAAAEEGPRKKK